MINLTFPDGRVAQYPAGTTGRQVAESISRGLAKIALGIKVNDEVRDLTRPIDEDARIQLLTWESEEGKKMFWHSGAHLMAEALELAFPKVKFGIGPALSSGFYYDIDLGDNQISQDDLVTLEKSMTELARKANPYIRKEISKPDAVAYFEEKGDEYKLDLLKDLEDGQITFYTQGNFTDLCRGPHLPDTGYIKAIKLLSIAGAYWKGDENNKQMTRIYGITFPAQKDLDEYMNMLEEAKKRDHRKLGKELELFTFDDDVGSG
ncbi:MAG: TGS domain-containing protein, partial [Bacteroidota bacterium]|nr:TGS domain-containing protein [Bacteroidota bacterium]